MLPATVFSAAPPAAPTHAAALPPRAAAPEKHQSTRMETPRDAPEAAVLEYLGRYGDAAIGLDPIGLDALDEPAVNGAAAPAADGDADGVIPPARRQHRDEH